MPFPPVQRRAALLLLCASMYSAGWWHHHLLHPQPPPAPAHSSTAQRPPPSARPPGYLSTKAPTAPPAAGAEALAKLLEQRAKPEDLAAALAAWAERDPDAAFRALLADPRLQLPATTRALFDVLGKNDPAQALQRLAELPSVPWARDANKGLATGWTQRDPEAATTAGLALPPGLRRVDFLKGAFSQWAQQNLIAAKDWLMALPPGESRTRIVTFGTIRSANIHNAQEMAALLELAQTSFPNAGNMASDPFDTWATKFPDDALQWALALPQEEEATSDFLSAALEPFAADPARVLSLLPQLKDPKARESLVKSAAEAWALRDPTAAWAWADQLTDPSLREAFENRFTFRWADLDPDSAIPWLLKNKADHLTNIDSDDLKQWAVASPEDALAMLGQLPLADSRQSLAKELLMGIAQTNPTASLSHLDLLEAGYPRQSVIGWAMTTWSGQDITAATAYTVTLPPGEDREAAIGGILGAAFKESPESAFTWALTLTDPNDKSREIENLLTRWRAKDPIAAQTWLDHAPLDDALRQTLTPTQP